MLANQGCVLKQLYCLEIHTLYIMYKCCSASNAYHSSLSCFLIVIQLPNISVILSKQHLYDAVSSKAPAALVGDGGDANTL